MDADKLLLFYEKLYFHEFETREKLVARLQLSLALLTAAGGVGIYIFSKVDLSYRPSTGILVLFWISYLLSIATITRSCHWFSKALWGHTYQCVPIATKIEDYRIELHGAYAHYEQGREISDRYFREFLSRYYRECASANAEINTDRQLYIHYSMRALVCSLPLLIVASITAIANGLLKIST